MCLTEGSVRPAYSPLTDAIERIQYGYRMSGKASDKDVPALKLQNESARQRWELFHRAIAHAKQSNLDALDERDPANGDRSGSAPLLSIVR
jgi:hypothetical protein